MGCSHSHPTRHHSHHFHHQVLPKRSFSPFDPSSPHYDDYSDDECYSLPSTSSLSSEFEDDDEENRMGEFFRVRGSGDSDSGFLRRHSIGDFLSCSEISNSKSVVKLWDTIGFGFDHSGSSDPQTQLQANRRCCKKSPDSMGLRFSPAISRVDDGSQFWWHRTR